MSHLIHEHQALVRHWGHLQTQIDGLLKDHILQREQLTAELMCLRAALIVRDTQSLWGLPHARTLRPRAAKQNNSLAASSVKQVICQSGCVSQAHAWLDEDHCRLYGGTCDTLSKKAVKQCA